MMKRRFATAATLAALSVAAVGCSSNTSDLIVNFDDRPVDDEHHIAPICHVDSGMADSCEQHPLPNA